MYIPHPHNHEEWSTRRSKQNAYWKYKQQANKKHKYEANAADPSRESSGGNLYLSKSFKPDLATQVMLYDQKSNQVVDDILNGNFSEDNDLKE